MGFEVRLTKKGLREERYKDEGKEIIYTRPRTLPELLRFWHYVLEGIDSDVVLGDVFDLMDGVKNIGLLSGLFSCDLRAFLKEAKQPVPEDATWSDIQYLEVYNTPWLEYDAEDEDFKPPYNITRDFHGWGTWEKPELAPEDHPEEGPLAIEYTPVNELADVPLRYNPRIAYPKELYGGDYHFETEITIRFGEFLHAIFWEIGFLGTPGDRNESLQELKRRVDEIESGDAELIPFDDVLKDLKDKISKEREDDEEEQD